MALFENTTTTRPWVLWNHTLRAEKALGDQGCLKPELIMLSVLVTSLLTAGDPATTLYSTTLPPLHSLLHLLFGGGRGVPHTAGASRSFHRSDQLHEGYSCRKETQRRHQQTDVALDVARGPWFTDHQHR